MISTGRFPKVVQLGPRIRAAMDIHAVGTRRDNACQRLAARSAHRRQGKILIVEELVELDAGFDMDEPHRGSACVQARGNHIRQDAVPPVRLDDVCRADSHVGVRLTASDGSGGPTQPPGLLNNVHRSSRLSGHTRPTTGLTYLHRSYRPERRLGIRATAGRRVFTGASSTNPASPCSHTAAFLM